MIAIIAAFIGGALYRLRGGWFSMLSRRYGWTWGGQQRTQTMRLIWSIPTACLMTYGSGAPWWMALVLTLTNWIALALFGTGQYIPDVPLRREPDWLGLARNALASVFLVLYAPIMFVAYTLSGACHALLYWVGHRIGKHYFYGEAIVGAVSWAVIVLSFQ